MIIAWGKQIKPETYTIIRGLIMFILPLMVLKFLLTHRPTRSLAHPLSSNFLVLSVSHFLAGCSLTHPVPQYVAHSCFCLRTVPLINWWVCGCNRNHDSRWTIHLLLLNFSNDAGSFLGLAAALHPPGDGATSAPARRLMQSLTLVYRWQFVVTFATSACSIIQWLW